MAQKSVMVGVSSPPFSVLLSLLNATHISAQPSVYHESASTIFRKILGSIWSKDSKSYLLPISSLPNCIEILTSSKVKFTNLPNPILDLIQEKQSNLNGISNQDALISMKTRIHPFLLGKAMEFQIDGIREAIKRGGRLLLGDEMVGNRR